jgi:hydroxymethylpyrimidine/phosphomethylpyrimidine kinase
VAGSDSSAGAGIQADLKAIEANGAYAASVITAITAQNTRGVHRSEALAPALVEAQLDAVFSDLDVVAVKTGMLANAAIIACVGGCLRRYAPRRLVCDPVMISKNGAPLLEREALSALREVIFPLTDLLTPNVHEAQALCDRPVETVADARLAGKQLVDQGARAVLIKGGHLAGQPATDVLVTPDGSELFEGEFIPTRHTHGTGCTYSAAIAAQWARGASLTEAIGRAKRFVTEAIRGGLAIGHGIGPTDPFYFLDHDGGVPSVAGGGRQ